MDAWAKLLSYSERKKHKVKITWLGLDNAGKSTFIHYILTGSYESDIPRTMGLNVDKFVFQEDKNLEIISWDLGGQKHYRSALWFKYMQNTSGIVFVVDSADTKRLPEAKTELWKYVLEIKDISPPLLVIANKQDLDQAYELGQIATELGLNQLKRQSFSIMPCSAITGLNVMVAMGWLVETIMKKM